MRRRIATAASLAGLALILVAGAPAKADGYETGMRMKRHHVVRHTHYDAGCRRVVVREVGYRYFPRAQAYSYEPQEYMRVYCAPAIAAD
jgi:hypothetical protein